MSDVTRILQQEQEGDSRAPEYLLDTNHANRSRSHRGQAATEVDSLSCSNQLIGLSVLHLVALVMAVSGAQLFGQTPDSFNPTVGGTVDSIAVHTDGKIVLGGNFTYINSRSQQGIARLSTDGTLDTNVLSNLDGGVSATAVQEDGLRITVRRPQQPGRSREWFLS